MESAMRRPWVTITRVGVRGVIVKKPDLRHTETEPFAEGQAGNTKLVGI